MNHALIDQAFRQGEGVLLLCPNWIPRPLLAAGRRLRLAPEDYSKLGLKRGQICERWFSATARAEKSRLPSETALKRAVRSAQFVGLKEADSMLQPV